METSSLSDGTGTGTFIIIESMEDNEAKDKTIELYERCKLLTKSIKVLELDNLRLRKQLRNKDILMDQNILVNDKRVRALKKKATSAELQVREASGRLRSHNNQRTSVPMMKMVATTLRTIAEDLVKEDDEVEIVFGADILRADGGSDKLGSKAITSMSSSQSSLKRQREEGGGGTQSFVSGSGSRKSVGDIPRSGLGMGSSGGKKMMKKSSSSSNSSSSGN